MSRERMATIRRAYEEVNANLEFPDDLFDPGYECDARDVEAGVLHGFEGMQRVLRPYWETFDGFHIAVEEVIHADEERVVTAVRDGGRLSGSEAEVLNHFFHIWTFGDGRIARLSIHTDKNRALEAAGLSE